MAGFVSDAQAAKAAGTSAADFIAGWEPSGNFADYTKGPAERLTVYVQDIYDATP